MSWTGQSWGPEQPRFVADLTGDGRADIVGFGLDGVWTSINTGAGGFQPPNMVLCGFNFHTGWLVESEDAQDLAIGIGRLMGQAALRRRLGLAAGREAVRRFSLRGYVKDLMSRYDSLVRAPARAEPRA